MKKRKFEAFSFDGNIKVTIEGESKVFGGADLLLKAVQELISSFDFKFQEDENPGVQEQYYISIIDSIGEIMKLDFPGDDTSKRNIEVVRDYLNYFLEENLYEDNRFKDLLDKPLEEEL